MYRPSMAAWYRSLVRRLPLKAIPSPEQRSIAKTFTHQPEVPWCSLSLETVHALVYAQAHAVKRPVDDRLAHELMAALTWTREIVVPDPARAAQVMASPELPRDALRTLGELPNQTTYVLIERPLQSEEEGFLNGVWLMYNCGSDGEKRMILLMDLLIKGKPVREVIVEFGCTLDFDAAVESEVENIARTLNWDLMPGAVALRESMREHYRSSKAVIALLYDTLVGQAEELAAKRNRAAADELGFTMVALGKPDEFAHALAAGALH